MIRERNTGTFCVSSRHSSFAASLEDAAIFLKWDNANKAIRDMVRGLKPANSTFPYWRLEGQTYKADETLETSYPLLVPIFDVVECEMAVK